MYKKITAWLLMALLCGTFGIQHFHQHPPCHHDGITISTERIIHGNCTICDFHLTRYIHPDYATIPQLYYPSVNEVYLELQVLQIPYSFHWAFKGRGPPVLA